MRKLILSLCILTVAVCTVKAQGNVASAKAKIEKSNAELTHPKKSAKASTWLKNSSLYADLAEVNISQFVNGIPATQLMMMLGAPINAKAPEIIEINGVNYTKYIYPSVDAYFNDKDILIMFIESKVPMVDALAKAEKSALEAYAIDPSVKSKVAKMLDRIATIYTTIGDNYYKRTEYSLAADNFYNAGRILSGSLIASVDTAPDELLYFSLISYASAKRLADAKPALDILISRNYLRNGDVLYYNGLIENAIGNKEAAEAAYIRGVKEFPENGMILNSLVAFYILNNEDPNKVIPFIKKAQEANPTNAALFTAEGIAYSSIKDIPNAIVAYLKAVELAPTSFDTLYNLGLSYYRMSDNFSDDVSELDYNSSNYTEIRNEIQEKIEQYQMLSLDVLLKAHAIDSKEKNTIELLRSIYFRQRNKSPEMMDKYNSFNELSKK